MGVGSVRIAIVSDAYDPYLNGVNTHTKLLKKGLEKLGHKTLLMVADINTKKTYEENGVIHVKAVKSKKICVNGIATPFLGDRIELIKNFNPDIIHIQTEFGVGFSGIKIAKKLKVPIVYTIHTMHEEYMHYALPDKLKNVGVYFLGLYIGSFAKSAEAITAPSQKNSSYLKKLGNQKEVHVLPNPVEISKYKPKNKLINKYNMETKFNITLNKYNICTVGRLGKEKSLDTLIEYISYEENRNINFYIIGDGPEKKKLILLCEKLGVKDRVEFLGEIYNEKLLELLNVFDAYITTSTSEANSIARLEAMSAGVPAFVKYDYLNEGQVKEGISGFVFKDEKEMWKKLRGYIEMDEDKKRELKSSTKNEIENFTPEVVASKFVEIYKSITGGI